MVQFFTALLVFSHFNLDLPKPNDVLNDFKPNLVRRYSTACLNYFKKPEFQGHDVAKLTQSVMQAMVARGKSGFIKEQVNVNQLVQFYNKVCRKNPDVTALNPYDKELKEALNQYIQLKDQLPSVDMKSVNLPQSTDIVSADKKVISDIYIRDNRRRSVPLSQLPQFVPQVFVTVEDGRFFEHRGIDEMGILRAVLKDLSSHGARQGASTISQQLARNLYLGFAPTLQRKLQEILIADQIERQISKNEILDLYLNVIYFGRNAWGIEKAAQSYFGKPASQLTLVETAFLAGIVHGPNLYRNRPDRAEKRVRFVLARLKEKGFLPSGTIDLAKELKVLPEGDLYNAGYVRDMVQESARKVNPSWLFDGNFQLQTTIDSRLQAITNEALQTGLVRLERLSAKPGWKGPLENIQEAIARETTALAELEMQRKLETEKQKESLFAGIGSKGESDGIKPSPLEKPWQRALAESGSKFPPPAWSWRLGVFLGHGRKVGILGDGEWDLTQASVSWAGRLKAGDVIYVQSTGRNQGEIVQPPEVNGAAIVMETDTGRVLALSGGFSYLTSSWNRATLALRQPGSLLKPFTYLAALQKGLQPNLILNDTPITFPARMAGGKSWTPENYGKENGPPRPMRWALENSRNVMTVHLATQIGLNPIRKLTEDFGVYPEAARDFSFVLGSQETSLMNLVRAYAIIGNEGYLVTPQVLQEVTDSTGRITTLRGAPPAQISSVDEISLYQLRTLLQGVVTRGTGARLAPYAEFFAGKTGTTNDSKDVWFIGFTPQIVIGVFVGYDNPESLGAKTTGGMAALPIVERILQGSIKIRQPEIFPSPPRGVILMNTNRFTGEITPDVSSDTVMEVYRDGAAR